MAVPVPDAPYRELRRALRDRVRVEDVLARFRIPTRGRGRAFCPFHPDRRRPSLTWKAIDTPDEGPIEIWRCWTCGQHGDLFTLLQLLGGYGSREEAIRALAAELGVPYPDRPGRGELASDRLLDMAADYYAARLSGAPLEYLAKRALPEPLLRAHRVGYAPASPIDGFARHCDARHMGRIAEALGLVQPPGDASPRRDWFRGRIIFPALRHGRVTDLQGRAFPDGTPKYLSLPSAARPQVAPRLYNHDAAAHTHVILCEGPVDTLSALAAGLPACGIYGTHRWTDEHRALFRNARRVYVALDRDATDRAIAIATAFGTCGRVLVPPPELGDKGDLNDWLVRLAGGDHAAFAAMLRDAMAAAPTPWELWIDRLPDLPARERHDQVAPLLRSMACLPRTLRDTLLDMLARRSGLPAGALAAELSEIEDELCPGPEE